MVKLRTLDFSQLTNLVDWKRLKIIKFYERIIIRSDRSANRIICTDCAYILGKKVDVVENWSSCKMMVKTNWIWYLKIMIYSIFTGSLCLFWKLQNLLIQSLLTWIWSNKRSHPWIPQTTAWPTVFPIASTRGCPSLHQPSFLWYLRLWSVLGSLQYNISREPNMA